VWRNLKRRMEEAREGEYGQIKSMPSWDARKRYDVGWWHLPLRLMRLFSVVNST
jgi:hypothetical protein